MLPTTGFLVLNSEDLILWWWDWEKLILNIIFVCIELGIWLSDPIYGLQFSVCCTVLYKTLIFLFYVIHMPLNKCYEKNKVRERERDSKRSFFNQKSCEAPFGM